MRKLLFGNILLLTIFAFSCQEKECCSDDTGLSGSWLLYETGYSPGGGYIVEPVPSKPAQVLTFHSDLRITTTMDGLEEYKFYRIVDGASSVEKILALFKEEPVDPVDEASLKHSYRFRLNGNDLKLYYRFCTEGCHMGFKRKNLDSDKE